MRDVTSTPARIAAEEVRLTIAKAIDDRKHFLVEAGAGAGKTYSLVEALQHVINTRGKTLAQLNQRVACITYTNVAKNEIEARTDRHPVVEAATLHAFLWAAIRDFQPFLRSELLNLGKWAERIAEAGEEAGDLSKKSVEYTLGHPRIEDMRLLLHHDDVIELATKLLSFPKFITRLASAHPIIFIDEYQDTDAAFVEALKATVLSNANGPQIGLFGDHWQAIYSGVCGKVEHANLLLIPKKANFRSVPAIVNSLNKCRSELPQEVDKPDVVGTVAVYHTNAWGGTRQTVNPWQGDLPSDAAIACHQKLLKTLSEQQAWDLKPPTTKVLMLTHRVLATQQGYSGLADIFGGYNDGFVKKEDAYIKFFAETIEPAFAAFSAHRYGEMLDVVGRTEPAIKKVDSKKLWTKAMTELGDIRAKGSIGDAIAFLQKQPLDELRIPDEIRRKEAEREASKVEADSSLARLVDRWKALRERPYAELSRMIEFIDDKTPFSTKHGVKGAEFDNVLVVIGRGWANYNFNQYLEWAAKPNAVPAAKRGTYERNRNLFYVACSRPRKHLALLFTQELSALALTTLAAWFGRDHIHSMTQSG